VLDYPVTTPENVRFHFTLAGPGTRLLAWLIDTFVLIGILSVIATIIGIFEAFFGSYATAAYVLGALVISEGYWIGLEHFGDGRTVGKRALGLRVVSERGLRLSFGQVVLRNLLRPVDMLPAFGGLGGTSSILQGQHRRLGDLVAGTLVVRERKVLPPQRIAGITGTRDRRQGARPLELPGSILRRVPPVEREFLLDLCLRRDKLDEQVRLALFRDVAAHFRELLDVTSDKGTSDERFVLELTAKLWERFGERSALGG
jgi:uncharacterized RDD family membrane protein YckC